MSKPFSSSLLFTLAFVVVSLVGCGGDKGPKSMTEGVPLSEIEAYEQAVRDMEAEDAAAMENIDQTDGIK